MDAADRIPIDIGYETSAPGILAEPRTTLREDGTIVIDLTPQPACPSNPSTEDEIVVCAQTDEQEPAPVTPPPHIGLTEKLHKALTARIGPLELGSLRNADGTYAFGARIRF